MVVERTGGQEDRRTEGQEDRCVLRGHGSACGQGRKGSDPCSVGGWNVREGCLCEGWTRSPDSAETQGELQEADVI